jgi:hypothetical protein
MKLLVTWVGTADLRAPGLDDESNIGPIAQALAARPFSRVLLPADQEPAQVAKFEDWLRARGSPPIDVQGVKLRG